MLCKRTRTTDKLGHASAPTLVACALATLAAMDPSFTPHTASSALKILRALASAEQQQCNFARGGLEETTDKLVRTLWGSPDDPVWATR